MGRRQTHRHLDTMVFVKVLKNTAYFKRFQVAKRRRREGKTDFKARRKMVRQDKNKFNNQRVICQVAYATIRGDIVVASATSSDLDKFGIPVGHKNYAAAYCTGMLVARRTLKKFGLDETFKGKEEIDGEEYHVEDEENDTRPFKAILDVGLKTTIVGGRMWGALKGAVDGGLHVPHSTKNFPGFKPAEEKGAESEYDAEAHKDRIFGKHVQEYMEMMKEEDPTKYEAHFSKYIKEGIEPDGLEDMYTEAIAKIKEDPDGEETEKKEVTHTRSGATINSSDGTEHIRTIKLTLKERRDKVAAKIQKAQEKMLAGDD